MDQARIEELAKEVHTAAEESHYASAAYAVEQYLRKKRAKELFVLRTRLNEELAQVQKERNILTTSVTTKRLIDELNSIREAEKLNEGRKLQFIYDELLLTSARSIVDNGVFRIVLPDHLQAVIREGLKDGNSTWTEEMKLAKNKLRRLALHELGHIVIDSEQEEKSTEPEAEIFTNMLLNLRIERRKSLKDGV